MHVIIFKLTGSRPTVTNVKENYCIALNLTGVFGTISICLLAEAISKNMRILSSYKKREIKNHIPHLDVLIHRRIPLYLIQTTENGCILDNFKPRSFVY